MPTERVVLIAFAYAGYIAVAFAAVFMWWVGCRALGRAFASVVVVMTAILVSLAWADGIAHLGKAALLGPCNPYYAACNGEHEGWTGPTTGDPAGRAQWATLKCGARPQVPVGKDSPLIVGIGGVLYVPFADLQAITWLGDPPTGSWCTK